MPVCRPDSRCLRPALRHLGYVLFDVLIAQLLLAVALLGGGMALVQALAASRAAALQTAAVDLLADLGESLHTVPVPPHSISDWPVRVARELPAGEGLLAMPESPSAEDPVEAGVRWRDPARSQSPLLQLPFVPPAPALP